MSLKHLAKGSVNPKLADGVLRFYNMRFCPFAQRTIIVLHSKNIKYDMVNIHLKNRPNWFSEKNPLGKVPVLEHDGKLMIESLVTCDYLDEVYPDPPLYPSDPWSKAEDKGLIQVIGMMVVNPFHKILFNFHDLSQVETHLEKATKGFHVLEKELTKRNSVFFGGDKPAMLDYMFWPWCERFPILDKVTNNVLDFERTFPKLNKYMSNLSEDAAVKSTILPLDQHMEFFASFARGEPNYDYGIAKL